MFWLRLSEGNLIPFFPSSNKSKSSSFTEWAIKYLKEKQLKSRPQKGQKNTLYMTYFYVIKL